MSKALSPDLRVRVLEAMTGGLSRCGGLWRECSEYQPLARTGVRRGRSPSRSFGRKPPLRPHRVLFPGVLAARQARARFRPWHDPALPHPPPDDAQEEDGPRERTGPPDGRRGAIDETWAQTNMVRTPGRALKGRRLYMAQPHSHWKTSTFVAGLTPGTMIAPFVLDGPINRLAFENHVGCWWR